MIIHEKPIEWYIDKLRNNDYFSFPGFGDSEWYAMLEFKVDEVSGLGQIHTLDVGKKLKKIFDKRKDERFLPASPKVLLSLPKLTESVIDGFLWEHGQRIEFYERDMVTDDLAAKLGGLKSLITQLQKMDVYIVSNGALRGLFFLNYKKFFEISTPNFHMEEGGIERVVKDIIDFGKPGVYLFSAGMSAAIMIDQLHGKIPNSFLIDCGSIWDAFVGISGQREWRDKLYKDPKKWLQWLSENLIYR